MLVLEMLMLKKKKIKKMHRNGTPSSIASCKSENNKLKDMLLEPSSVME